MNNKLNETFDKHLGYLRKKLILLEGITDTWFDDGGFDTYKKPAVEQYEIAAEDGTLKTLEGEQQYKKGYYILTGPKGEKYSMPPEKFNELKDDLGDGKCSPKKIMKVAKLADHDGSVNTSWGAKLDYTAGNDYIVKHGPGDYGVVKKDIFDTTYNTIKESADTSELQKLGFKPVKEVKGYILGPMDQESTWIAWNKQPKNKNGKKMWVVSAADFQNQFPNIQMKELPAKLSSGADYYIIDDEGDLFPYSQANIGSGLD
jgi:hypothetical protein